MVLACLGSGQLPKCGTTQGTQPLRSPVDVSCCHQLFTDKKRQATPRKGPGSVGAYAQGAATAMKTTQIDT